MTWATKHRNFEVGGRSPRFTETVALIVRGILIGLEGEAQPRAGDSHIKLICVVEPFLSSKILSQDDGLYLATILRQISRFVA